MPGDAPPPAPVPDPSVPDPSPPSAAETVALGELPESAAGGQAELAAELERERKVRKDREIRLAELEDENRTLRQVQSAPPRRAAAKSDWFEEL